MFDKIKNFIASTGLARTCKLMGMNDKGAVSMAGVLMIGIAMIFLAVGFIIYPIVLTGTETILAWTASDNTSLTYGNVREFTGLSAVAAIVPLIVLIGFVASAVIEGMLGVKTIRGEGGGSVDLSGTLLMGIGMIFVAIGLIIFPVIMDGIATALNASAASTTTFTGLDAILRVVPLICLVSFVAGGIVAQYFGTKKLMT